MPTKTICKICEHIFNDSRGIKQHFLKKHKLTEDYLQYLKPLNFNSDNNPEEEPEIIDNSDPEENNDAFGPLPSKESNIIPLQVDNMPKRLNKFTELQELFDLVEMETKLAKAKLIASAYKKYTRDFDSDKELSTYDDELYKLREELAETKQDMLERNQSIQTQQTMPIDNGNETTSNRLISELLKYAPKLISEFSKPKLVNGVEPLWQ